MMTIDEAIEKFIRHQRAYSAQRTVEYYIDNLRQFKDYINEHVAVPFGGTDVMTVEKLTTDMFVEYVIFIRNRGIKNVSVNTYTRAVKTFSNYLVKIKEIPESFTSIKFLRSDAAQIVPLTKSEVELVDKYFRNKSILGKRNYLIFHLLVDCGLRKQEIIHLDYDDIKDKYIVIRQSKGEKSRIVPLPPWLSKILHDYRKVNQPLFLTNENYRLTEGSIEKLFVKIRKGTKIKRLNIKLCRHTFGTSYLAGGGNLEMLRILMGHSEYETTKQYLHLSAQMLISGADIYRLDDCFFTNYNSGGVSNG